MISKLNTPPCLAVDIGGTKIALGVFSADGTLLGKPAVLPVPFDPGGRGNPAKLVDIIHSFASQVQTMYPVLLGVGLSVCGNVDMRDGNCLLVPNLHWRDVPLGKMVGEATGLPVFAATDTRQAALVEHTWGSARGIDHFCWCTVGTGYGGYLFLDGVPFDGYHGIAGPFGHNTIDEVNGYPCGCGRRGCVETYVAGPAIARRGQQALDSGASPALARLAGTQPVSPSMVADAFRLGDPAAVQIIQDVVRMIAISLSGVNNLLDLQLFILGGGVIHALPELVGMIDAKIRAYLMSQEARHDLRIVRESFSNSSLYGAAALVFQQQPPTGDGDFPGGIASQQNQTWSKENQ